MEIKKPKRLNNSSQTTCQPHQQSKSSCPHFRKQNLKKLARPSSKDVSTQKQMKNNYPPTPRWKNRRPHFSVSDRCLTQQNRPLEEERHLQKGRHHQTNERKERVVNISNDELKNVLDTASTSSCRFLSKRRELSTVA